MSLSTSVAALGVGGCVGGVAEAGGDDGHGAQLADEVAARSTPSTVKELSAPARDHWLSVPAASAEFQTGRPFLSPS
jgi:hypothetical protein